MKEQIARKEETGLKENAQVVEELVSSLGVPVALLIFVCAFLVFMWWQNREDRAEVDEKWQALFLAEQEKHKEEVEKMTEALNNNTIALTKIVTLLSPETDSDDT